MANRKFKETTALTQAGHSKGFSITCSKCPAEVFFSEIKGGRRLPSVAAQQHFQRKGWVVGASHRKDLCPACANARKEKPMPDVVPIRADPPKQMGRDERRIINDKLDEVYGTESYKPGWTDQKVAADLGIPRAWVEEVRKTFFGEAGSNPLYDEYFEKAAKVAGEVKEFERLVNEAKRMHADIENWRVKISQQCDELWRIGKRLEKEIGR